MIEGHAGQVVDVEPLRLGSIIPGLDLLRILPDDTEVDNGDRSSARVAAGFAERAELLQRNTLQSGLLGQLAGCRLRQILVDLDEPARQGPTALIGFVLALNQQQLGLPSTKAKTAASAVTIGRGQSYTYLPFFAMTLNSFLYEIEPSEYDTDMVGPYEKILLIKPSALGDVVTALPALSALRRSFPQARISWLIRPAFAPLIEGHPHLDEIILFDRKFLAQAWHNPAAGRNLLSLISKLRQSRFDAVLDLQGLFRTGLLAWLSGCPQRFGPRWREMAHLFYTTSIPPRLAWVHVVDYYLKLVEAMGASDLRRRIPPAGKTVRPAMAARALLAAAKASTPTATRSSFRVPPRPANAGRAERFAALVDRLASEHGLAVVATGSKSESAMIEKIRRLAKHPPANLAGQTSLPELVEVLRRAKLVVSNDTGPGQIAAALGRPLVMMFSWSNPLRVGPYGRPQCVVARDISSRGLANRSHNPQHGIQHITLEEVYAKAVEQLEAGGWRL